MTFDLAALSSTTLQAPQSHASVGKLENPGDQHASIAGFGGLGGPYTQVPLLGSTTIYTTIGGPMTVWLGITDHTTIHPPASAHMASHASVALPRLKRSVTHLHLSTASLDPENTRRARNATNLEAALKQTSRNLPRKGDRSISNSTGGPRRSTQDLSTVRLLLVVGNRSTMGTQYSS